MSAQTPRPVDPESLPRPSLRAARAAETIVIDGVLDEPSWARADTTSGVLWATQPQAGVPGLDRSVVRVLFDDDALYVGARLYDGEPHRAASAGLEQDFRAQDSDLFGVALDPHRDQKSSYVFAAKVDRAREAFEAEIA